MKKTLAILLILTAPFVAVLTSSFVKWPSADNGMANVEQIEGIYVFMLSKPVGKYEYMGTVEKKGIVMSGKPEEMLNIMIKKAKKEYPQCQAIVFTKVDMYKADCIKFKE